MKTVQLLFDFDAPPESAPTVEPAPPQPPETHPASVIPLASGEKAKARDILTAIRTLKQLEREHRPATQPRDGRMAAMLPNH